MALKGVIFDHDGTLVDTERFHYQVWRNVLSEYDIDRVAHQLKGFRSRIYREDWIGQARSLHYDKHQN